MTRRDRNRQTELKLELIQSYMAQKPVLRGEVRAPALRVRPVSREEADLCCFVQGASGHARNTGQVVLRTFAPGDGYIDLCMEAETRRKIAKRQGRR